MSMLFLKGLGDIIRVHSNVMKVGYLTIGGTIVFLLLTERVHQVWREHQLRDSWIYDMVIPMVKVSARAAAFVEHLFFRTNRSDQNYWEMKDCED